MPRWGLMLVNLGTPDDPGVPSVRRYLREFLMDPRVLDINPVARWTLLNTVILPKRPKESSEAYQTVWTDRGSPLLFHGTDLADKVGERFGDDVPVKLAMRYQNPSIPAVLDEFVKEGVDQVVVFPLFPQYSSAAWGSAVEKIFVDSSKPWNGPSLQVVPPFYDHPAFLDACVAVARPHIDELKPDKILMSFHGLPERHCTKSDLSSGQTHCLKKANCCDAIVSDNRYCYRAQSYATARGIAERLELSPDQYEVSFQSRLGKDPWIQPYTDHRVAAMPGEGVKRLGVMCPSFVADCLETVEEIGMRARDDFMNAGGDAFALIPCVNAEDPWADAVVTICKTQSALGVISSNGSN